MQPSSQKSESKQRRAQSTVEYLTTYGWVIIIIAIVLLALFELGIFNLSGPSTCTAQPGYVCSGPVYGTNSIQFMFGQNSGKYYYGDWVFIAPQGGGTSNSLPQNFSTWPNANAVEIEGTNGILAPGETVQVSFPGGVGGGFQKNSPVGTQFSGYVWFAYCTSLPCGVPTNFARVADMYVKETGTNTSSFYNYFLTEAASPIGDGTVSPGSGFYLQGSNVIIQATAASGYTFNGWSCAGSGCSSSNSGSATATITMNSNITEVANFQSEGPTMFYTLNIIVSPSGGGTTLPSNGMEDANSLIPIYATPNSGYTFNSWTGTCTGGPCTGFPSYSANAFGNVIMTGNIILTAILNQVQVAAYSLNMVISPSGGGSVGPGNILSSTAGENVIISAFTNSGYTFNGWIGTGSGNYVGTNNPGTVTMEGNIVETAIFSLQSPTVTAISPDSGVNGGSISINSISGTNFLSGTTVNLIMAGQSDIECTGFTLTNSNTLSSGSCPISGAAAGAWNVVATNPNGQNGILTGGFTITVGTTYDPTSGYNGGDNVVFDSGANGATLTGSILTTASITINSGVTLTTDGYSFIAGSSFDNLGTLDTGWVNNGGGGSGGGGGSFASSYAGSGASGGSGGTGCGCQGNSGGGGSTLAPGGSPVCACGGAGNPGGTPSAPTVTNTIIDTWYTNGMDNYVNGGGGGGAGGNGGGSAGGGGGAYGIYVQAYYLTAGVISAPGQGGGTSASGGGGGGGGAIILAYGIGGYVPGTYNIDGGSAGGCTGGCGDQVGGAGGSGQIIVYSYGSGPPVAP